MAHPLSTTYLHFPKMSTLPLTPLDRFKSGSVKTLTLLSAAFPDSLLPETPGAEFGPAATGWRDGQLEVMRRLLPPRGLGGRALPRNSAADPGSLQFAPTAHRSMKPPGFSLHPHPLLPLLLPRPLHLLFLLLPPPTILGQSSCNSVTVFRKIKAIFQKI